MGIVLASASPRRKELLEMIGVRGLTANGGHVAVVNSKTNDTATLEFAVATGYGKCQQ